MMFVFVCKQNTAYEMRIRDWSSDLCSSDLRRRRRHRGAGLGADAAAHVRALGRGAWLQGRVAGREPGRGGRPEVGLDQGARAERLRLAEDRGRGASPGAHLALRLPGAAPHFLRLGLGLRSEEHTSDLQSLMRTSYAVFCLKKKKEIVTTT